MDISFELHGDTFLWDQEKAIQNFNKHGVKFEEAATVFGDPMFKLDNADRNDEKRDAAIGFDERGRLLYVVHIEIEDEHIRIISARRATDAEEFYYAN